MPAHFLVNLIDGPGNDSSVLVIGRGSIHSKSFTRASLPVAHDCAVVAVGDLLYSFQGTEIEHVFLRCVVHDFIEFEFPVLGDIIYKASALILRDVNCHVLHRKKQS